MLPQKKKFGSYLQNKRFPAIAEKPGDLKMESDIQD
jgi:hypothetical protein